MQLLTSERWELTAYIIIISINVLFGNEDIALNGANVWCWVFVHIINNTSSTLNRMGEKASRLNDPNLGAEVSFLHPQFMSNIIGPPLISWGRSHNFFFNIKYQSCIFPEKSILLSGRLYSSLPEGDSAVISSTALAFCTVYILYTFASRYPCSAYQQSLEQSSMLKHETWIWPTDCLNFNLTMFAVNIQSQRNNSSSISQMFIWFILNLCFSFAQFKKITTRNNIG